MNTKILRQTTVIIFILLNTLFLYGEKNLLLNPGMEEGAEKPTEWSFWGYNREASFFSSSDKAKEGTKSLKIENRTANDARALQYVKVKKNRVYKLSGWILAENIDTTGKGANFTFTGFSDNSPPLYDTRGEWVYTELIVKIGDGIDSLEAGCALGGYSGISQGTAYFDDVRIEELKNTLGLSPVLLEKAPAAAPPTQSKPGKSLRLPKWIPGQSEIIILILSVLSAIGALLILILKPAKEEPSTTEVIYEQRGSVIPPLKRTAINLSDDLMDYGYYVDLKRMSRLNYIRKKYYLYINFDYRPGQLIKRAALARMQKRWKK